MADGLDDAETELKVEHYDALLDAVCGYRDKHACSVTLQPRGDGEMQITVTANTELGEAYVLRKVVSELQDLGWLVDEGQGNE